MRDSLAVSGRSSDGNLRALADRHTVLPLLTGDESVQEQQPTNEGQPNIWQAVAGYLRVPVEQIVNVTITISREAPSSG